MEVQTQDPEGRAHELTVGFQPGEPKRMRVDGADVERLSDTSARPLVSVFLPDRLELVKGPPALRRSHLDQVVAAIWPGRAGSRRAYSQALAQRNALLGRIRSGRASRASLPAWDAELARHGIALREDRAATVELLAEPFTSAAGELGLTGDATLRYRPRSTAPDAEALAAELAERVEGDLERGFTGHGPHRDDLVLARDGRELRAYGSQGEQRMGLLALLLAERDVLADERGAPPLLLLDDVMSELDSGRRAAAGRPARVARPGARHDDGPRARPGRGHAGRDAAARRRGDRARRGRGGARRMRHRRAPRPLSDAVGALADSLRPATGLASVQAVWEDAVGPAIAREARPVSERARHRLGGLHVVGLGAGDRPHGARAVRGHQRPSRPRAGARAARDRESGETVMEASLVFCCFAALSARCEQARDGLCLLECSQRDFVRPGLPPPRGAGAY